MTWTYGRVAARVLAAAGLAAAGVGLAGAPASARVTVDPARAESGGYSTLAFAVSTERPDVRTTRVEIRFPDDHPMAELTTEPKPGWDVTVDRIPTGAGSAASDDSAHETGEDPVAGVTWTASTSDAEIDPGSFEMFRVSVGPLPAGVDLLLFEARQTYSDGEVVTWDESPAGGAEDAARARPAPALALMDPGSTDVTGSPSSPSPTNSDSAGTSAAAAAEPTGPETTLLTEQVAAEVDDDDRGARVALGLAAGGVLIFGAVAATAFARRRDRNASSPGV